MQDVQAGGVNFDGIYKALKNTMEALVKPVTNYLIPKVFAEKHVCHLFEV